MEKIELKIRKKEIIYVGLAFFTILMLWQVYNFFAPLFLNKLLGNTNGSLDYLIGIIMAADNIFALVALPIIGILSDKTNTKFGKRMPYIVIGAIVSLVTFPFIAVAFLSGSVAGVIVLMGIVLIAMNLYRNPAVSLMPDFTPKPLRSKANAIINFIGYLGAIIAGGLAMVVNGNHVEASSPLVLIPFLIASALMLGAIIMLFINIKEKKLVEEAKADMEIGESLSETEVNVNEASLTKRDRVNVLLIIISMFLWFVSFNAIETFWSTFGTTNLKGGGLVGLGVIVMTISSLITFLPATKITEKIGRKLSIVLGLSVMVVAMLIMSFARNLEGFTAVYMFVCFAVCGFGWAIINVNSFPMLVEYASGKNIGKYTGLYYIASSLAQSLTPVCAGLVMGVLGRFSLFPYSCVAMVLALIVFMFVKTKSNKQSAECDAKEGR